MSEVEKFRWLNHISNDRLKDDIARQSLDRNETNKEVIGGNRVRWHILVDALYFQVE